MLKTSEDEVSHLVQQVVINNDNRAFERLVRMHQSQVRSFLRKLTNSDIALADDLAQETFFKAYQHLSGYKGSGRFLGWLFKIAYQQYIQQYRKRKNWQEVDEKHISDPGMDGLNEEKLTVDRLIQFLPLVEKTAIILHYQYGMSHPEVSENMNIPVGTVKTHIRNAKLAMQKIQAGAKP